MKRKTTDKTDLKLQIHRETLRALEPSDAPRVDATSRCHSGVTCCQQD